jgi:soluble lytic murein transglycosylase-like protein
MGAWAWVYRQGFAADGDARKADGIYAIKQELIHNGFGHDVVLTLPFFGRFAASEAKRFQAARGLIADGIVGPITARVLFRKRLASTESQLGIPDNLLAKLVNLESNDDPVAEGTSDPNDEGIAQINLPSHPDVSESSAHDPAFAIPWAGRYLKGLFTATGGKDWDGALVAYNAGTDLAKRWLAAGKPATGGPQVGGEDGYARATRYVELVRGRAF